MKKYILSKITVICTVAFILVALLAAVNEILDIPSLLRTPATPINWIEIGIDIFWILIVGAFAIYWVSKLDLESKQTEEALPGLKRFFVARGVGR